MALTFVPGVSADSPSQCIDTAATSTAVRDIAGGPASIKKVTVVNPNAAEDEHLCFYNNVDPTVGTTAPDMILFIPRNQTTEYSFPESPDVFTTAVSYAAKQQAGTAGTTTPTSALQVMIEFLPS